MKIINIVLIIIITTTAFTNAQAQTVDEIIKKWADAMGGKERLGNIKTIYTEDELTIMNNPGTRKTYLVNDSGFKSETDFNGQKIIDCYKPDSGWSINPLAGVNTPVSMPATQVKLGRLQMEAAGRLFNYEAKGGKVALVGKENVNGSTSYNIELITGSGINIHFFIDSVTFYILKEVTKINADGQDIEVAVINSDFRKTGDGYVIPFSQEITVPGITFTIISKKVEINKEIDWVIFEKPKS